MKTEKTFSDGRWTGSISREHAGQVPPQVHFKDGVQGDLFLFDGSLTKIIDELNQLITVAKAMETELRREGGDGRSGDGRDAIDSSGVANDKDGK